MISSLISAGGRSVTRDDLLTAVWDYADHVATHTLESHIYRLRRKLKTSPKHPSILLTMSGGYRLGWFPHAAVRRSPLGSGARDAGHPRREGDQKETGR